MASRSLKVAAADEASTHGAGWRSRPAAVERLAVPEITYYALISEDHPRERPEGLIRADADRPGVASGPSSRLTELGPAVRR